MRFGRQQETSQYRESPLRNFSDFGQKKAPILKWRQKYFPAVTYSPTLSRAVPSALRDLTSVFGMGTGVSPSLSPPETVIRLLFEKYK
jgi:hypothetical protein